MRSSGSDEAARASRLALLYASLVLAASAPAAAEWRSFRVEDGLVSSSVKQVLCDSTGALWFVHGMNGGGISRFDGFRWSSVSRPDDSGPIFADQRHRIWTVGRSTLYARGVDGWESFSLPAPSADLADVASGGPSGRLFLAFASRVYVFSVATLSWDSLASPPGFIASLQEDNAGRLWAATAPERGADPDNLWRLEEGGWRSFGVTGDLVPGVTELYVATPDSVYASGEVLTPFVALPAFARLLCVDSRRGLWAASPPDRGGPGRLYRYTNQRWTAYEDSDALPLGAVTGVIEDPYGAIWIGCDNRSQEPDRRFVGGVVRIGDGTPPSSYLLTGDTGIWDVHFDRRGTLWILDLDARVRWTENQVPEPPSDFVWGETTWMHEDRRGNMWFDGLDRGLWRFDGFGWQRFPSIRPDQRPLEDAAGRLWFVNTPSGSQVPHPDSVLGRLDGNDWKWFGIGNGLPDTLVTTLLRDRDDRMWAGTRDGIAVFDPASESFTSIKSVGGHQLGRIHAACVTENGSVWAVAGLDSEFAAIDLNMNAVYLRPGGLQHPSPFLVADPSVGVWLATAAGTRYFDGTTWGLPAQLPAPVADLARMGLAQPYVDRKGTLWLSTGSEVVSRTLGSWRLYPGVGRCCDEDDDDIPWSRVPVARFNGEGWVPLSVADGKVVPFGKGRVLIQQAKQILLHETDLTPPRTILLSTLPRVSTDPAPTITVGPATGDALLEFQYRVDDSPWPQEWSASGTFRIPSQADGEHSVTMRSRDHYGNVDPLPQSVTFEVHTRAPSPTILRPLVDEVVTGTIPVLGQVADSRFASYRVRIMSTWSGVDSLEFAPVGIVPPNDTLAVWVTNASPDGRYFVEVAITDTTGLVGTSRVPVTVDNQAPWAFETSPRTIDSAGGVVHAADNSASLYIPSGAFTEPTIIVLEPDPQVEPLPGGVLRMWSVGWGSLPPGKPIELAVHVPEPGTGSLSLAIARMDDDGSFTLVGGTLDPTSSKLTTAITEPGRYVVAERSLLGASPLAGLRGGIRIQPRVLELAGIGLGRPMSINFSVEREGPVTVGVYNRAGRIVRRLESGRYFGTGVNTVYWDGRDDAGSSVVDGLYVVAVEARGSAHRSVVAVVR